MTDSDVLKFRIKCATSEELKELTLMLLIEATEKKMLSEINHLRMLVHEQQIDETKFCPIDSVTTKQVLQELTDRIYR
jgi:hypothetical protein